MASPASGDPQQPAPGLTVDRYRLVCKLGEGGMGSVWKAEDTLLGRNVALKFLADRLVDSEEARRRFLREARAACALHHPGIATVHDAGQAGDRVWIAFHLVDGETIAERLARDGPLPVPEALRIAIEAAEALGHAHGRGVLHRDVTSRNLMLDGDGRVVIVDFGLALPEDTTRITRTGTGMGTAAYLAPEVVQGKPGDARSDLYGLGVVLYEMLTGTAPFTGERVETVLYAAVHEAPQAPSRRRPDVSAELDTIVLRALAKEPTARFQAMDELAGALHEGVLGARTGRRRPHLTRVLIAAVAGLVAFAGAVWLVAQYRAGPATYSSVAVLPLRNVSADPASSAYLADGIGQALVTKLTQMSGLRVTPWMTSRRHPDTEETVDEILGRLEVDALLTGTFEQAGERIRGSVALVDGTSGQQVWAADFDEPIADLFEVQRRIATGAATRLHGRLSGREAQALARTVGSNVDAYQEYLKGVELIFRGDEESTSAALARFERAVELDENLAEAYVGIGSVHYNRHFFGWEGGLGTLAKAKAAFDHALEIDPSLVAAYRGLIRVAFEHGRNEECLKLGKLAAGAGGDPVDTLLARADGYWLGGLAHKAVSIYREILEKDPDNEGALWHLVIAEAWSGRFGEAVEGGRRYFERFGEDYEIHLWVAFALWGLGDTESSAEHFTRVVDLAPRGSFDYQQLNAAIFFRKSGNADKADEILLDGVDVLEGMLDRHPDDPRHQAALGVCFGLLGDMERMREEEARAARWFPDNRQPAFYFALGYAAIGDLGGAVELARQLNQPAAFVIGPTPWLLRLIDRRLEERPDFQAFLHEHEAEVRRRETLY